MTTVVYPGSFNPWHQGHDDILRKAIKAFDHVTVVQMENPTKSEPNKLVPAERLCAISPNIKVVSFRGMLVDCVKQYRARAVIRGLRNGQDLEYEKAMQYWNEDLGLEVPTVCFITDRELVHISSSALRDLERFKKGLSK